MTFTIKIEPEALVDIQDAIDWYNSQQTELGQKFYHYLEDYIEHLKSNPYYQIRYSNVRCIPLRKFPFMVHFTVDEQNSLVVIRAVFNTSLNPEKWKSRGG